MRPSDAPEPRRRRSHPLEDAHRHRRSRRAVLDAERGEDLFEMRVHGSRRKAENLCDVAIGLAARDPCRCLGLACGQGRLLPKPPIRLILRRLREGEVLGLRLQAKHVDDLAQEGRERHLVAIELKAPGLDAGDVEQAVDQAREMFGGAPHDADRLRLRGLGARVPLEELRVAEDRIERRAQFVADADVRSGDGAGIGVRHVDLQLRDDDEGAGEGERRLRRIEHVAERIEIHLRRLGRALGRRHLLDRQEGEEGEEGAEPPAPTPA